MTDDARSWSNTDRSMISTVGLTANLKPRPPIRRRRKITPIVLTIALACLFLILILPWNVNDSRPESKTTQEELQAVERINNGTSTIWIFHDYQWLYQIECLFGFVFEVHNCSGINGTVTYNEYQGNDLCTFDYHGESTVYLGFKQTVEGGWDGSVENWYWFGNVTRDWRAGNWTPEQGIEFVHDLNQTFMDAKLVILYFVPIPEFNLFVVVIACMVAVVLLRRSKHEG